MRRRPIGCIWLVAAAILAGGCASSTAPIDPAAPASVEQLMAGVDIPYERFTLENSCAVSPG